MKITKEENFRVVVEPYVYSYEKEDAIKRTCESIKEDIKRHVDGFQSVIVEWDTNEICSLCGRSWEVDEDGLPQCCLKAQDEFNASEKLKEYEKEI